MFCNIVGELVGFTELGDMNQQLTEFEAHLKNGTAPTIAHGQICAGPHG